MNIEPLNETYANTKIQMSYPCIEIINIDQALPVILSALESGKLPLIGTYKGVMRQLALIDVSALNLSKLLAISPLRYHETSALSKDIADINDIFEIGVGM